MALAKWFVAKVGEAICTGIYEDTTQEIHSFDLRNPSKEKDVRLTVRSANITPPTKTLKRDKNEPTDAKLTLTSIGKRIVEADGEINFPAGMTFILRVLPKSKLTVTP